MKETIRSFIAIPLPYEIQSNLAEFSTKFGIHQRNGFRPVKAGNIHLTLKFLGDTTSQQIDSVKKLLFQIVQNQTFIQIKFEGVGAFPNWNQPRIIWVGMTGSPALENLYKKIDQSTVDLGFASEGRRFSPHLTLARVNSSMSDPQFARAITAIRTLSPAPSFGEMQAKELILFKSDLQPGGPIYSALSHHPFLGRDVL